MHWSTLLVLSAGLAAPQSTVAPLQFNSYTKAYHAVSETHKPLIVILNPSEGTEAAAQPITLEQLQADPAIGPILDHYVVAIVDVGTEHGREVQKRFAPPALPFVAVCDERLEKQVYRTQTPAAPASLQKVIAQYKDGVPAAHVSLRLQPPGDCPNCRRNWMNF